MITFIRWFMIKAKEIKYRLVFWKIVDQVFLDLAKHPEEVEKKLTDSVVRLIVGDKSEGEPKS